MHLIKPEISNLAAIKFIIFPQLDKEKSALMLDKISRNEQLETPNVNLGGKIRTLHTHTHTKTKHTSTLEKQINQN